SESATTRQDFIPRESSAVMLPVPATFEDTTPSGLSPEGAIRVTSCGEAVPLASAVKSDPAWRVFHLTPTHPAWRPSTAFAYRRPGSFPSQVIVSDFPDFKSLYPRSRLRTLTPGSTCHCCKTGVGSTGVAVSQISQQSGPAK